MDARLLAPLTAVVLLLGALSGCVDVNEGGLEEQSASPEPTSYVEQTQAPAPREANLGRALGAIQGLVVNDQNASLDGVYVSLLGTSNFTTTDAQGRFAFSHLAAGSYRIRADKNEYRSIEENIRVDGEKVTFVRIVLASKDALAAGFREHFHDLWGDSDRYTLFDDSVEWPQNQEPGSGKSSTDPCVKQPGQTARNAQCYTLRIPIDKKIVPPGARELVASGTWKKQEYVKEITLQFTTANATFGAFFFDPTAKFVDPVKRIKIPNGETRNHSLDPADADHGHARFSAWKLEIVVEFTIANALVVNHPELIRREVGSFHLKFELLKGIIPVDPPHLRFWINGSRLPLATDLKNEVTTLSQARDPKAQEMYLNTAWMTLTGTDLVPPGTTRLELTLKYSTSQPALEAYFSKKTLAFRHGNTNPELATLSDLRVDAPTRKDPGITTYVLNLKPEETDAFYQKRSNWLFMLSNDGKERDKDFVNECSTGCGKGIYLLTVVAINDNWEDDFKAGRV